VRLDNYVYTVESLRAVRRRLAPGGLFVLSFAVPRDRPWLALKLDRIVEEAFGEPPLVLDVGYDVSLAFLAGPGLGHPRARAAASALATRSVGRETLEQASGEGEVALPTDDWPHLYLRDRAVPPAQLLLLGLLAAVSLLAVRLCVPSSAPASSWSRPRGSPTSGSCSEGPG
jgi:hypothetical protein